MKLLHFLDEIKTLKLEFGDNDLTVNGVSLPKSPLEGTLCFVSTLTFLKSLKEALGNQEVSDLGLVFDSKLFKSEEELVSEIKSSVAWLATSDNFEQTFCDISKIFYDKKFEKLQHLVDGRKLGTSNIHPTAEIAEGVFIGDNVEIGAHVKVFPGTVIMSHSSVGSKTVLFSNTSVYPYTKIGSGCRIHSGTVIGSEGFGFNFLEGEHKKIWQSGGVTIGNNVEIGSNCTIDCGTFIPTKIGDGCKIDNLVQIAHNTIFGNHVVFCGTAGTAGSVTVGDYSVVGGRVSIAPGVELGKACQVAGGAGVTKNWPDGSIIAGFPAVTIKDWRKSVIQLAKLSRG